MGDRPQIQQLLATKELSTKLRLYGTYVRGIHERITPLFALLTQAGPDVGEVLELGEQERLTGVTAFVTHLDETGALRPDADPAQVADTLTATLSP